GGLLAGAAVLFADTKVGGGVRAAFDGDLLSASSLTVQANGRNFADTDTLAVGFGLALRGAGSRAPAQGTAPADVVASAGTGAISAAGVLNVLATSDNDAVVESDAGSGGIVGITGSALRAKVGGGTRAELSGDVTSASAINVTATGNNNADADALAISFGLFTGAAVDPNAEITSQASVEALIGSAADITVGSAPVDVSATSTDTARAESKGV